MKKRTMWTPLLAAAVFFMGMNPMTAMASDETGAGGTDGGMIYDLPEESEDNPGDFETDDV